MWSSGLAKEEIGRTERLVNRGSVNGWMETSNIGRVAPIFVHYRYIAASTYHAHIHLFIIMLVLLSHSINTVVPRDYWPGIFE